MDAEVFIYFRAPHVSVMWDDVVRCVVLERTPQATDRDVVMARRKALDLLRAKKAKRCMVQCPRADIEGWVAEAKAAGMRALALVVSNTADVAIDFRASIARIAAGDIATRCFDRIEHARLWLVTATNARHSSNPKLRLSGPLPRVSIPPRKISIHPSIAPRRSRPPRM